jgi:hypothetical protein
VSRECQSASVRSTAAIATTPAVETVSSVSLANTRRHAINGDLPLDAA